MSTLIQIQTTSRVFRQLLEVVPKLASGRIKGRQVPSHGAFFIGRDALDPTLFLHIRNQIRSFGTTSKKKCHWVFIGYSLPVADFEIRHLLKTAQMCGHTHPKITCVVRDKDEAKPYQRFFGIKPSKVYTRGLWQWRQDGYPTCLSFESLTDPLERH